jgi:TonB family protein
MWLENLAAYSLQVAVLIAAGTALVYIFRLKAPTVLLVFWQGLLAVCLLLPAFQPWRQVRFAAATPQQSIEADNPLPVVPESNAIVFAPSTASARTMPFPTYATIAWILACGVGLRLLWLALGLLRLNRYLNRARRLAALPESIRDMKWRIGVAPEILFSADIDSPVTFGWRQSAVLFPASFTGMRESMQRPIACHELLHVERRDWLFIVFEEILRSFFWFHPAIWWVLGRIHLSREQVVDREVLRVMGERGPYLESLLHIASLRGRPVAVPAPLLLRERHLVQRVALMLKESKMTKSRLIFSLAAIAAFLLWTGTYATAWFPLNAPPILASQDPAPSSLIMPTPAPVPAGAPIPATIVPKVPAPAPNAVTTPAPAPKENAAPKTQRQEPIRVGSNVQSSKLIKKVDPVYPELARRARVEQIVMLEVLVDEQGNVANIRVVKGHPLLDQAAIDAVRQWQYSPTYLNGQAIQVLATVEVPFLLSSDSFVSPSETPRLITGVVGGSPAAATNQGGIKGGIIGGAPAAVTANPSVPSPPRPRKVEPMRVGGNVQESKLIKRVEPVYPELAKRARLEQIVMLEVSVDEEGYVSNIRVIRGHPLLDQAAIDAVKQWVYSPTLLNGEKIPVVATVSIVFSLSPRFTLDADGYIKDAEGTTVLVNVLRETEGPIQISPLPQATFEMIQQTLTYLVAQGVRNVSLNSTSYVFAAGRLFYRAPSFGANSAMAEPSVQAPVLDVNLDQLQATAEAVLRQRLLSTGTGSAGTVLNYTICVDEAGRIVDVQGPPVGLLDIPEITTALRQARVKSPGLRGNIPVPASIRISISVMLR